jgi:hypothetical protein
MLSMTTGVLTEGFTTEDFEKEIDASIAETHMQAEQFTATSGICCVS